MTKNIPAATVRAWARENIDLIPTDARACLGDNARGRLHSEVVTAFSKANKGKNYVVKVAEKKRTIVVPVVTLNKAGNKATVKRTLSTTDARKALGQPTNRRGRISVDTLSEALSAVEAAKVASSFK